MQTKQLGAVMMAVLLAIVALVVVDKLSKPDRVPTPGPAGIYPASAPVRTSPIQRGSILFYVANWDGQVPPPIAYAVAGEYRPGVVRDPSMRQWQSDQITVVPGVTYFMSVGSATMKRGSGTIRCFIEVDGNVVTNTEPRDADSSPGAIRCKWTAP